ncbi:hybrid sensor histidine kinase/response regulator [Nodosilinea sp. E11]|uniref:ATP-binding response regulator n=1 Tax=Nodosilinea sp. E11 TaxID=3037479 RepID=UPI0029343279|nr:response regulator [Nodosilinea sp. E11]WOD40324.1 response regulator [Nodosilinea sp. E11]
MNSSAESNYSGNILIVDDSPDNLRVLSTSLTNIGYKVRCVTNGEMALLSINSCPPDLILLDICMPVLDGYAVCQKIKANPSTKDIPIIFLSALDNVVDKVKAFQMGGADYVTKPFHTEEILARIANQLTIQRLQHQLATQNQKLKQEIEAHKKTESALQDAKEAAEIANHAKSNFIARMSHELRTPLNSILGFSGLMNNSLALSPEHKDYVKSIYQSARLLLQIINQILSITKGESNQISLSEQTFDLYSFLKSIASDWQFQAQKKGLNFDLSLSSSVPRLIRADVSKLRQIVLQLLKNSVQFTDSGQVSLRVMTEDSGWGKLPPLDCTKKGARHNPILLFFEIEDTGSGIADYEMSRLFQAFSQTESGQRSERGVGLGLYISHQYLQAIGGNITLSSTPGQGTNVRFYVPVEVVPLELAPEVQVQPIELGTYSNVFPKNPVVSPSDVEGMIIKTLGEGLSTAWVNRLNRAAIQGSDHQIAKLIQDIPGTQSSLVAALSEWNRNFQFDQIITITQRILEGSNVTSNYGFMATDPKG